MLFQKVKGFHDTYGADIEYWEKLENALKELFRRYGFREFRLPILEKTAAFKRGIGETTDIVEKEMFTFIDSDDSVSLRPEGTASLMRAYIENGLASNPGVKKYFYMGNMFRRERPQKGRFRQFTQIGAEALECDSPLLDAEIIALLYDSAKAAGIEHFVRMEINSIGCPTCRPAYREMLIAYLDSRKESLCDDCLRRLERNPMRILDCKNEKCIDAVREAPLMKEHLCAECSSHFDSVKSFLDIMGTPYSVNGRMVRGLDYYVRTAFELVTDKLGAASAVGAGGRYDGLIKLMGGKDTSGIGFAIGMDRIVSLMKENETLQERKADFFIIFFDDEGMHQGLKLVQELRTDGFMCEYDYDRASMKSQFKKADRSGARYAVIFGADEMAAGNASIKDLETGTQILKDIESLHKHLSTTETTTKSH